MDPILRPISQGDAAPVGAICYAAFKAIAEHHAFDPDFPNPEAAIGLVDHMLSYCKCSFGAGCLSRTLAIALLQAGLYRARAPGGNARPSHQHVHRWLHGL